MILTGAGKVLGDVAAVTFIFGMIFLRETHGTLIWDEVDTPA